MTVELPHRIDIHPWLAWKASGGGGGSWTRFAGSVLSGGYGSTATSSSGFYIDWEVLLDSGTWELVLIYYRYTDQGIVTCKIDDVSLATIDMYGASAFNTVGTISGIVISDPGTHTLRLTTLTKNASATTYNMALQHVCLRRTGA